MAYELFQLFILCIGVFFFVSGLLITYSDKFFRYWYGTLRGDRFEKGMPSVSSSRYILDRYWAGGQAVLGGLVLMAIYVSSHPVMASYMIDLFTLFN